MVAAVTEAVRQALDRQDELTGVEMVHAVEEALHGLPPSPP